MNLKKLSIGYVPYELSLAAPGDRRRFVYFAKKNGIPFELAKTNKFYDIILLTPHSNLSSWLSYKKKHPGTKFIFEMVDSLVFSSDLVRNIFKGAGRYVSSKESRLYLNYKTPILKWVKIADAVICSSTELKNIIEAFNKNVFVSLDYLQNEVKSLKTDYEINGKMKLAWEGQGAMLENLLKFKNVFKNVSSFCELHIITDSSYNKFGNHFKKDVFKILDKLPITTVFHKWVIYKNYEILSQCDCGIIPLNNKNLMGWHKPANKLISFGYAGLPTVVSNTPAYVEFMQKMNSQLYCSTEQEWISKITLIKDMSANERELYAANQLQYISTNFSEDALSQTWFDIFNSVIKN